MKIEWSSEDIKSGRRVKREQTKETWMIGYRAELGALGYVLVSMSDGMVTKPSSKGELSHHLTQEQYFPIEFFDSEYLKT